MKVLYSVPVPYTLSDHCVEVYGDPDMGWYEYRIVCGRRVFFDTKDTGYGSAEIALRDGLIMATGDEGYGA